MESLRNNRICQKCGTVFTGTGDLYYCRDCAMEIKKNVLRDRICKTCGVSFLGGPGAIHCHKCAAEASRENNKRYKRTGPKRPLGSIDKCQRCGKKYIVRGSRQKYCDQCAKEAILEAQRERKKEYNQKSHVKEIKALRRTEQKKLCEYCAYPFSYSTSTTYCSGFCKKEARKITQAIADVKRGKERNLNRYENNREIYRRIKSGGGNIDQINELLESCLQADDYRAKINFLIAGLVSAEANDTEDNRNKNNLILEQMYQFCDRYIGDKQEYIDHIKDLIKKYLESAKDI